MPSDIVGLFRPTTIRVLDALAAAGDDAIGLTFDALATRLGVAERSIRRAFRELEGASFVRCAHLADRRKYVAEVTMPTRKRTVEMRGFVSQPAHNRPTTGPQPAHNRPKIDDPDPL